MVGFSGIFWFTFIFFSTLGIGFKKIFMSKILLIDDQKLILLALEKQLTYLGYDVYKASTVEEGIRKFDHIQPDLVLLDMNLPETLGSKPGTATGIEFVKYLRWFMGSQTPIVVLSGNTDENLFVNSLNIGVSDFLHKPVELNQVLHKIEKNLGADYPYKALVSNDCNSIIPELSKALVIPIYNEECLLEKLDIASIKKLNQEYYLCFVNNTSTVGTLDILGELVDKNPNTMLLINSFANLGEKEIIERGVKFLKSEYGFEQAFPLNFKDLNKYVGSLEACEHECSIPPFII